MGSYCLCLFYYSLRKGVHYCQSFKHGGSVLFYLSIGLMCGSSQEGFTIPLSASVFICSIFNYKKLNRGSFCLIIGLWLGTALVVFAPGTLKRGNSVVADFDVYAFIQTKIQILMYSKRFMAFLLILFLAYMYKGKQYCLNFICDHIFDNRCYFI